MLEQVVRGVGVRMVLRMALTVMLCVRVGGHPGGEHERERRETGRRDDSATAPHLGPPVQGHRRATAAEGWVGVRVNGQDKVAQAYTD